MNRQKKWIEKKLEMIFGPKRMAFGPKRAAQKHTHKQKRTQHGKSRWNWCRCFNGIFIFNHFHHMESLLTTWNVLARNKKRLWWYRWRRRSFISTLLNIDKVFFAPIKRVCMYSFDTCCCGYPLPINSA